MTANNNLPPADQLHSTLPGLTERPDPAPELKDRLQKRSVGYAFRKLLFKVFMLMLVCLIAVGFMTYAMAMKTMVKDTTSDYKECKWTIGKYELTGRRTYTYPYTEIFGHRIIDRERVTEQTVINTPKDTITIVGLTDQKKWWGEQQEEGPAGTMKIKAGKMYVVVIGKNYGAFDHESFCKQQPTKGE